MGSNRSFSLFPRLQSFSSLPPCYHPVPPILCWTRLMCLSRVRHPTIFRGNVFLNTSWTVTMAILQSALCFRSKLLLGGAKPALLRVLSHHCAGAQLDSHRPVPPG